MHAVSITMQNQSIACDHLPYLSDYRISSWYRTL